MKMKSKRFEGLYTFDTLNHKYVPINQVQEIWKNDMANLIEAAVKKDNEIYG